MPSNSKSTRKPQSKPVQKSTPKNLSSAVKGHYTNFFKPNQFVETSGKMALDSLKNIVDDKGTFKDWHNLMYRMYAGSVAYTDYFKPDDGIVQSINNAVASLQLIMLRTLCTGVDGFGMRPSEMDRIIDALSVIDTLSRYMLPEELMTAYNHAGYYIDDFIKRNKAASDQFMKKQAMLKQLADEYRQATSVEESCCV